MMGPTRVGWILPFVKRKNSSDRQQSYNDVHGWYRARIEQLFCHLWHWVLVRNIWHGSAKVCACYCISHSFASGGKYCASLMVHGIMCRRMFGPLLMTQALH